MVQLTRCCSAPNRTPRVEGASATSWSRFALIAIAGLVAGLATDASARSRAPVSVLAEKVGEGEQQARIFLTVKGATDWDVFAIRADGAALRNLNRHPDDDVDPTWSPTTGKIAFVRLAHGDQPSPDEDVYVMNADGTA